MVQSNPTPTSREPVRGIRFRAISTSRRYGPTGTTAPPSRLTVMQLRIWWLSVAGKFFEGLVVFLTGVALPLIAKNTISPKRSTASSERQPARHPDRRERLGGLSDRFGRKPMFVFEMGLFILFLVLIVFTPNFYWLVVCLFGMGLALGCDYPTAHLVISESTPTHSRANSCSRPLDSGAAGALMGTAIGYLILANDPDLEAWRWMYATAIIPAALVLLGRFFITESLHWLAIRGREREAENEILRLLRRTRVIRTRCA
ncbi:MAG: MFS transporter [Xanthobacteraceae bacterium]